ncbi:hypothetical protein TREES_T100009127 [Tupaia chinensis]|uniref:Uncharacterized protein n=1 Tax=Tupaia chinensis TaxID=246437 RepID=L9KKS9_TUPCH|nr:hypothetical protein TREES_T100009127 [Tupaia chinensis]
MPLYLALCIPDLCIYPRPCATPALFNPGPVSPRPCASVRGPVRTCEGFPARGLLAEGQGRAESTEMWPSLCPPTLGWVSLEEEVSLSVSQEAACQSKPISKVPGGAKGVGDGTLARCPRELWLLHPAQEALFLPSEMGLALGLVLSTRHMVRY